jgi:hypothetical protein
VALYVADAGGRRPSAGILDTEREIKGMTITAGLSATKTGFDLIKSLREALGKQEVNPGDIQARLVELQSLMLDAQRSLADADEENRLLKAQNQELKRMSSLGNEFVFEEGVYWRERSPYCPICWDIDRKAG